jgi:hypothetical protein
MMSEPSKGRDFVTPASESWETRHGICLYFDGLKSPGVTDPTRFGRFLLNQKQIDDTRRIHGEDSPIWWSQRRGFFPPEGISNAVIDEPMLTQFKMTQAVTWAFAPKLGLAYDPSYSTGGDRCMTRVFAVGVIEDGTKAFVSLKTEQVKLVLSKDTSLSDIIGNAIAKIALREQITPDNVVADCTGSQGAVTDVVERLIGKGVRRIQYAGRQGEGSLDASVNQVTMRGQRAFYNKRAEMYYAFRMFGRAGQIRGLDAPTCRELTQTNYKKATSPILIEDKEEVKKRIGTSPDDADTVVMGLDLARYVWGFALAGVQQKVDVDILSQNRDVDSRGEFCLTDWEPERQATC